MSSTLLAICRIKPLSTRNDCDTCLTLDISDVPCRALHRGGLRPPNLSPSVRHTNRGDFYLPEGPLQFLTSLSSPRYSTPDALISADQASQMSSQIRRQNSHPSAVTTAARAAAPVRNGPSLHTPSPLAYEGVRDWPKRASMRRIACHEYHVQTEPEC